MNNEIVEEAIIIKRGRGRPTGVLNKPRDPNDPVNANKRPVGRPVKPKPVKIPKTPRSPEQIKEDKKVSNLKYYEQNYEKIKNHLMENIKCEVCQTSHPRSNMSKHNKTKKHIMNSQVVIN